MVVDTYVGRWFMFSV